MQRIPLILDQPSCLTEEKLRPRERRELRIPQIGRTGLRAPITCMLTQTVYSDKATWEKVAGEERGGYF